MNKDMNNLRKTVRPKAHASPRENAMYRSFGSLYSRGKYHIFFEHFPFGLYSSHRFVGHAESDDLIFWKSKPIAIYSTKTNDFDGAYEGSCLVWFSITWESIIQLAIWTMLIHMFITHR